MVISQKLLHSFFIFFLLLLCTASCNTTEPPPDKTVLTLTLEDVSCTEAWLTLTANNLQLPATLNLLKDNTITKTITLQTADTLLYIDSLLPNQTYNFKLSGIGNPVSGINSNELSVTTLDTTSHNFTFQTWTFGTIGSSVLYDVAIIDENNIIAVGEIMVADSSPNGYTKYSYLKWNGTEWELGNLKYFPPGSIGDSITTTGRSVFSFSDDDVWISGGAVFHWNGSSWKIYYNTGTEGSNKIWGTSSNNLYFVGSNGNITHHNGSQWKKIESGTSLILSDIKVNNRGEIFICGLEVSTVDGIIIKSENGTDFNVLVESGNIPSNQLFNPKLSGAISSISIDNSSTLYAAGNLVYQYKFGKWNYLTSLPENYIGGNPGSYYRGYIRRIRAWAPNDIWIVGERNTARHFNGLVWQQVGTPYNPQIDLVWRGIESQNNITVIAGSYNNNAIIMTVKR